jgi:hypothetical protein
VLRRRVAVLSRCVGTWAHRIPAWARCTQAGASLRRRVAASLPRLRWVVLLLRSCAADGALVRPLGSSDGPRLVIRVLSHPGVAGCVAPQVRCPLLHLRVATGYHRSNVGCERVNVTQYYR